MLQGLQKEEWKKYSWLGWWLTSLSDERWVSWQLCWMHLWLPVDDSICARRQGPTGCICLYQLQTKIANKKHAELLLQKSNGAMAAWTQSLEEDPYLPVHLSQFASFPGLSSTNISSAICPFRLTGAALFLSIHLRCTMLQRYVELLFTIANIWSDMIFHIQTMLFKDNKIAQESCRVTRYDAI